jgi:BirA family biotin operon repressor/biotin-[acetyl-CoA-carboxylase] ligase
LSKGRDSAGVVSLHPPYTASPLRRSGFSLPKVSGDLVLLTAVATCDAIKACTDVTPTIQWPNDLMVSGRKVGGILIESRSRPDGRQTFVIGIGINCLQHRGHLAAVPDDRATSLDLECSQAVDRTALAVALLGELDRWLDRPREWLDAHLRAQWLARAEPMGQRVRLQNGGRVLTGSMVDLDPGASLVVRLDDGSLRAFDAATTSIVEQDPSAGVH